MSNERLGSFLGTKILLIEHSSLIRMVVKNLIKNIGITEVSEAEGSSDALQIIKSRRPDIVCMSYIVYEVENRNIFDEIYSVNPNTRIIILSSTPYSEVDHSLIKKYGIDFIPKTPNYELLIESIKGY